MMNPTPKPKRGEIWFTRLPTDPPDKGTRPVVIVSSDARNLNDRATTVLAMPLTTTLRDGDIVLQPAETGLTEISALGAHNLSTLRKLDLIAPRNPLRRVSEKKLREGAVGVLRAMGLYVSADAIH